MKKFTRIVLSIALLFSTFYQLNAQSASNQMKLFFEKAYLHLDREYYVLGDDIWFKAYLLNGQTNYPIYTSNNLYVELIAPDATVTFRDVIRLENGVGNGDFRLTDSLNPGTYHIRAYTNWMKNFGDNFIYDREIKVGNKTLSPSESAKSNSNNKSGNTPKENYSLHFFPEGGSLVANVASVVGLKAEDANGKGIAVKGNITDSKNKVVASFTSNNLGLGSFTITPLPDESYDVKASVVSNNKPINADIDLPLAKGLVISVKDLDTAFAQATIKTNKVTLAALQNSLLTIIVKHAGKKYFEDSVRLSGENLLIKIPKDKLPKGVSIVTLYDEKGRPNSERLFYVDKESPLNATITTNKRSYAKQESTVVNINTLDKDGNPLKANLSMSVVDGTIVPVSASNMINYVYLQSEIKGQIEQADRYFDINNKDRSKDLDLLLLTQGWRDFIWLRIAQQGINIKYIPESGITISGKVRREIGDKPLRGMNVTLFASQATGNKLFSTQSDSAGRYFFDGVNITGTSRVKVVSKDNKGKSGGFITLDDLFNNKLPVKHIDYFNPYIDTASSYKQFSVAAAQRISALDKARQLEINELPGVTVTSTKEKVKMIGFSPVMDAGYKDSVFTPDASDMKNYETLENYLLHKMNGAQTDFDRGGITIGAKKYKPRITVENREDLFERLDYYALPVNVISKVVIEHSISVGDSMGDVYFVHLTLKPEATQQSSPDLINKEVTGYYQARSFYVPQFKPSLLSSNYLTTLYWKPDITTENGSARVVFSNKTLSPKWSVIVEGITDNGLPISSVVNYEVK